MSRHALIASRRRARPPDSFDRVWRIGIQLPGLQTTKRHWAGGDALTVRGKFVASLAAHRSAEADTLVVRCDPAMRELLLADAPDTYYVTDYYEPHAVILVRLGDLTDEAVRDLLTVSLRLATKS